MITAQDYFLRHGTKRSVEDMPPIVRYAFMYFVDSLPQLPNSYYENTAELYQAYLDLQLYFYKELLLTGSTLTLESMGKTASQLVKEIDNTGYEEIAVACKMLMSACLRYSQGFFSHIPQEKVQSGVEKFLTFRTEEDIHNAVLDGFRDKPEYIKILLEVRKVVAESEIALLYCVAVLYVTEPLSNANQKALVDMVMSNYHALNALCRKLGFTQGRDKNRVFNTEDAGQKLPNQILEESYKLAEANLDDLRKSLK
jgi:hypothetical protein